MHTKKARIHRKIPHDPGSPKFIEEYPSKCSEVVNNLSKRERKECVALAKEWNAVGPPREIQMKCVMKPHTTCATDR